MENLEVIFMVTALSFMFAAVAAKMLATQLIARMNRSISQVEQIKSETMDRLKGAQNQKQIVERNHKVWLNKRRKIANKLARLKKEMITLQDEENQRKQRSSERKIE